MRLLLLVPLAHSDSNKPTSDLERGSGGINMDADTNVYTVVC